MKCLSVLQPWPWAILYGGKPVENRSWGMMYRGPLLIHAGKSDRLLSHGVTCLREYGLSPPQQYGKYDFGAILGVARLFECHRADTIRGRQVFRDCAPWADPLRCGEHLYYWVLIEKRPFTKPIPYRGRQGLFDVTEPEVLAAIDEQLSTGASSPTPDP